MLGIELETGRTKSRRPTNTNKVSRVNGCLQLQDEHRFTGGVEDLLQSHDVRTRPTQVQGGGLVQRLGRQTGAAASFADHFGRELFARRRVTAPFHRCEFPPIQSKTMKKRKQNSIIDFDFI